MIDRAALSEWREKYGCDYDDQKFWILFDWIQAKKKGRKYSVSTSAKNTVVFVSHIKYYIDTVRIHKEYAQIEFNNDFTMFKRVN